MKRLLILSGKGGTGKTTTAAAFVSFAKARAFADCDVDAPNLHLVTSAQGEPERSVFRGGDLAVIDPERCVGCGKCCRVCRFDALRIPYRRELARQLAEGRLASEEDAELADGFRRLGKKLLEVSAR